MLRKEKYFKCSEKLGNAENLVGYWVNNSSVSVNYEMSTPL